MGASFRGADIRGIINLEETLHLGESDLSEARVTERERNIIEKAVGKRK